MRAQFLTLIFVCTLISGGAAQAAWNEDCGSILNPSIDFESAKKERLAEEVREYIRQGIFEKSEEIAPYRDYTPSVQLDELVLSIGFWWYPANVWHEKMMSLYAEQGARIQEELERAFIFTPDPTSLPSARSFSSYSDSLNPDSYGPHSGSPRHRHDPYAGSESNNYGGADRTDDYDNDRTVRGSDGGYSGFGSGGMD